MNQEFDKPVKEFTEKQRKAFKACMKFISAGNDNYSASKSALVSVIRSSGAYERKNDAVKALKMLLKNPNTPLEVQNEKVTRNDIETAAEVAA